MYCSTCKVKKIGPNTAPYGGYLCVNEHLQCHECHIRYSGSCGRCNANTNFVQMNYNSNNRAQVAPTAPPLEVIIEGVVANCNSRDRSHPPIPKLQQQPQPQQSQPTIIKKNKKIEAALAAQPNQKTIEQLVSESCLALEKQNKQKSKDNLNLLRADEDFKPVIPEKMVKAKPSTLLSKSKSTNEQIKTLFVSQAQHTKSTSRFVFQYRPEEDRIPKNVDDSGQLTAVGQKVSNVTLMRRNSENRAMQEHSQDNSVDAGIIHSSELRFFQSSDSLKNYYSGSTVTPTDDVVEIPKTSNKNRKNPNDAKSVEPIESKKVVQESLSVKAMHKFESQNRMQRAQLLEGYLHTYGKVNSKHLNNSYHHHHHNASCYHHKNHSEKWDDEMPGCSTSASTDSEPKLPPPTSTVTTATKSVALVDGVKSASSPMSEGVKYKSKDYIVMHTESVVRSVPVAPEHLLPESSSVEKNTSTSIDMRMQQVLETFSEHRRCKKPIMDNAKMSSLMKDLVQKPTTLAQEIAKLQAQGDGPNFLLPGTVISVESKHRTDEKIIKMYEEGLNLDNISSYSEDTDDYTSGTRISNSHRAYYNPPMTTLCPMSANGLPSPTKQPAPQYQLIDCNPLMGTESVITDEDLPIPAYNLTISRAPVKCPESMCHRMIFVSDFNKHLIVDHSNLPTERICSNECKNFFIDPRISHKGLNRCHMVYLIRDKVSDLGSSKFKDFLPLLIMSTRINLSDLLKVPAQKLGKRNIDFLMIWATGIAPEEFPVLVSLIVWSRTGPKPCCHLVHSSKMSTIRETMTSMDIYRSGKALLLAASEVFLLTNGGRDMIELQLVVR